MDDPWGLDQPPAVVATEPLPPRLAALAAITSRVEWEDREFARPEELPEVAALVAAGWYALDDAPYVAALPAVWPREHRCWVADRRPKVTFVNERWAEPWTAETYEWVEADRASDARLLGLPDPPRGRLWLLRTPWPGISVDEAFGAFRERMEERGLRERGDHLALVAREMLAWPEVLVRTYLR